MPYKSRPENERERLRQKELKNNALGSMNEGFNRTQGSNLADMTGSLGWKGLGILIIVLILGFVIYNYFFK